MGELKLKAHIGAELSQAQLKKLASRLTQKRCELAERVEQLEQQMLTKDDCSHADAADAASAQENRLRASGMGEQHQQVIIEIDAALRRLSDGRYGVSETTGEPIACDRLMLIPWARTSADEREK